jgi:membrane-associated protease RseP (regulator of RpoE activity)
LKEEAMNLRSTAVSLVGLAWTVVALAEPQEAKADEFNPFAESYVSRMSPPTSGPAVVQIFSGEDKVVDHQRLLEDGYDLLGYSSFESGNVAPEKLKSQAAALHADLALIYSRGLDTLEGHAQKTGRTYQSPADPKADTTYYEYFATYWTKLPMPLLGLHVQRAGGSAEGGLEVVAVIKQSPADLSGVQNGDVLSRLGEVALSKPEELVQAAQRYAGQSVDLHFSRDGEPMRKTVVLNQR